MCDDPKQGRAARGVSRAGDVLVRIPFVHMARAGSVRFGSQSRRSCAFARYRRWRYRITLPYRRCRRAPAPYRPDQFTVRRYVPSAPVGVSFGSSRFMHHGWAARHLSRNAAAPIGSDRRRPMRPGERHGGDPTLTRCEYPFHRPTPHTPPLSDSPAWRYSAINRTE